MKTPEGKLFRPIDYVGNVGCESSCQTCVNQLGFEPCETRVFLDDKNYLYPLEGLPRNAVVVAGPAPVEVSVAEYVGTYIF